MRALVTGAAGFIGSHVVRALLARGHDVRAMHLASDSLLNLRDQPVELVRGDVTDRESVRRAVDGCDWVFHLAAIYALWLPRPQRLRDVNVEGTRIVLDESRAAGVKRVIYTSSIARFGGQGPGRDATEESSFALGKTGDAYAKSKAEAHDLVCATARAGQEIVIVAPTGPLGPGDVGPTPTGRLLLSALTMPAVIVTRSETCFADVRDMARAHVAAAERGVPGETYLLGSENVSLDDLARRALRIAGKSKPIITAPYALATLGAKVALAWTDHVSHRAPLFTPAAIEISKLGLRARCDKAHRDLGMPLGSIDRALADQLRWFEDNGYTRRAA